METNRMNNDFQNKENDPNQTIVINQTGQQSNGIGITGFVLSIIAIFLGWIPILGWLIWLLGLIFSFIGIFKEPKGLSIAGLVISLIGVIFLILVFGTILGVAAIQ